VVYMHLLYVEAAVILPDFHVINVVWKVMILIQFIKRNCFVLAGMQISNRRLL
jgi:hypothetical protein